MAWDFLNTDEENVIQPSGGGGFSQIYDPVSRGVDRSGSRASTDTTQAPPQDQQSTLQATYADDGREGGLPSQPSQPISTLTQFEQAQEVAGIGSQLLSAVSPVPGVGAATYGLATFSNVNEFAQNLGGLPENNLEFSDLFDIGVDTLFGGASFTEAALAQRFSGGRFNVGARTASGTQQRKTAAGVSTMVREGLDRYGRPTSRREAILEKRAQQSYEAAMSSLSAAERSVVDRTSGGDRSRAESIARGISAAKSAAARARDTARDYVRSRDGGSDGRGDRTGGGSYSDFGDKSMDKGTRFA